MKEEDKLEDDRDRLLTAGKAVLALLDKCPPSLQDLCDTDALGMSDSIDQLREAIGGR